MVVDLDVKPKSTLTVEEVEVHVFSECFLHMQILIIHVFFAGLKINDAEFGQEKQIDTLKLESKQTEKLSALDLFRHKRLLINAVIIWVAW